MDGANKFNRFYLLLKPVALMSKLLLRCLPDSLFFSIESRMELWGNDLAGGILLQEPYQTRAYQQEIKTTQATPNRFVNLTYLSPAKQVSGIGLQDQTNYNANLGAGHAAHHALLSPQSQTLPHANVHPTFSRGLTMPSLNAQEAYAAAMAGFDTHKIAGHGTLKRLQHQQGTGTNQKIHDTALQHTHAHLQKSHTDGQLKLRTTRNESGAEEGDTGRITIMGANSSSSIDSGVERSLGLIKHGGPSHSSEQNLVNQPDTGLKEGTADSGR